MSPVIRTIAVAVGSCGCAFVPSCPTSRLLSRTGTSGLGKWGRRRCGDMLPITVLSLTPAHGPLESQALGNKTFRPRSSKSWPLTVQVRFGAVLAVSGDRPEIGSPRLVQVKCPTILENQGGRPDKNRYIPNHGVSIAVVGLVPLLNKARVDSWQELELLGRREDAT